MSNPRVCFCSGLFFLLCLWLFFLVNPALAQKPRELRVGVYNYEPLIFYSPGQGAQGLYIDILEAVADNNNWKLNYVYGTWDQCMQRLESGEIDLLPNIAYTLERAKKFEFTEQFMYLDWGIIYTPNKSSIHTLFDLQGKSISVLKKSIYAEGLSKLLDQFDIQANFIELDQFSDVLAATESGKSDAGLVAQAFALKTAGNYNIAPTDIYCSPVKIRVAAKKHRLPEVIATLNHGFNILKNDKSSYYYQRLHYWTSRYNQKAIPSWLYYSIISGAILVLLLVSFVVALRKAVHLKTNELRESEKRLQRAIDNAPFPIMIHAEDGEVLQLSKAWCKLSGYRPDEIPTVKYWVRLACSENIDVILKHIDRLYHAKSPQENGEVRITAKDGRQLIWDFSSAPLGKLLDNRQLVITMAMDITRRKQAQENQLQLEQQMLHTQKLESLGVLAGGIAHDFNNILTSVLGHTELAQRRLANESPATRHLAQIKTAASKAADLANQMLAYSGKGKFVVEPLDLNLLIEEMMHMLNVSISKGTVLRYDFAQHLPTIEADATQIRQVIMNLVINASEAIGEKSGTIAIVTGVIDCNSDYLKDVWLDEGLPEGLYTFVEVADTGCGMDQNTRTRIFDPFFSTKFTGRGLGMAAVIGIIRSHKGAIKVYSEVGKGTTIKILFPSSTLPAALFNKDQVEDNWQGDGTVLMVDDEETVRGIGKSMLQELGFDVISAVDGKAAVSLYKERKKDIKFVLMDLTMPHMNGEEAFRELRMINPQVKVIIASGYNEQEVTRKFAGKGLSGFLQKPYELSSLSRLVRQLVGND